MFLHKFWVLYYICRFCIVMLYRGIIHDWSKFTPAEAKSFIGATTLKNLVYGSPEYVAEQKRISSAIEHHYKTNSHHPEHFPLGTSNMNLMDIIEMYCDWKAAVRRNKDGDFQKSLDYAYANKGDLISREILNIFFNTHNPESAEILRVSGKENIKYTDKDRRLLAAKLDKIYADFKQLKEDWRAGNQITHALYAVPNDKQSVSIFMLSLFGLILDGKFNLAEIHPNLNKPKVFDPYNQRV